MKPATNPVQKGCRSTQPKTHRRAYIRILREAAGDAAAGPASERDSVLSGELILGGYLEGQVFYGNDGCVEGSATAGITVAGRLFLQQLEKEEREQSRIGRLKAVGLVVGGGVLTIAGQLLLEVFKSLLHLK